MNRTSKSLLVALLCSFTLNCVADTVKSKDEWFASLRWYWGGALIPVFEGGYRKADVYPDGDVEGIGASFSIDMQQVSLDDFSFSSFQLDRLKLFGINGDDDLAAELGAGYSLLSNRWFLNLGAQGDQVTAGADLMQDGDFRPYIGVTHLDYKAPAE